jgi:hypothetical protein
LIVVVAALAASACKTDKPEVKPIEKKVRIVGSGSTATTIGSVEEAQPELDGGRLLQVRTKTDAQIISHWCIEDAKGRDAASKVAETLRREGWDDVSMRGAADRFGVAGKKADLNVSATVGGREKSCSGTLVIMTTMRLPAAVAIPPATEPVR